MNNEKELVDLHDISISYPKAQAPVLDSISLRIQPYEHVAIIGANGVGKTTLLKKIYSVLASRAAFIHQEYSLVPQLSVFHNIFMGRLDQYSTLYNIANLIKPFKKEMQKIDQIAAPLGISTFLMKKVGELSGGQQQRTAIARALFHNTDIYLADEPVSAIDPANADSILHCLTQKDKTAIASMHNIDLALHHFNRIVGIKNKKIFFDLPHEQVTESLLSSLYS